MNAHHSNWLLGYLDAITLRAAVAKRDVDLICIVFSHRTSPFIYFGALICNVIQRASSFSVCN